MSYKWNQIYIDIGYEKYRKSYSQNFVIEKVMFYDKFINI